MKKFTINNQPALVDDLLADFTIHQRPSTNIEFFGSTRDKRVFVQFKTGQSYIYSDVPGELIADMEVADSIGSFVAQLIVKPNIYPALKYLHPLVKLESEVVDGDQFNANDEW